MQQLQINPCKKNYPRTEVAAPPGKLFRHPAAKTPLPRALRCGPVIFQRVSPTFSDMPCAFPPRIPLARADYSAPMRPFHWRH